MERVRVAIVGVVPGVDHQFTCHTVAIENTS